MNPNLRQLLSSAELWRARDLSGHGRAEQSAGLPTGFDRLDRLLPGQGWPRAALSEILCDSVGIGELGLVAPGLARLSREQARWITWIDPPFMPHAPALAAAGIDVGKLLLIRTGPAGSGGRDAFWALEQALESGACSAVLAWLDERRLRIPDLRRMHLRAQHGRSWAVLFRPGLASRNPSAAELRLCIRAADSPPEAFSLPQNGTPPTPKEQPASRWTVSTCSMKAAPRRLLLSILKRRGGWGMDDLPLELEAGDDLEALLRLWRCHESPQLVPERQAADAEGATDQPVGGLHLFDESPQLVPERQAADAEGATDQPVGGLHLFDESPQLVPERQAADAEGATDQPVGGLHLFDESPQLVPERQAADAEGATDQPVGGLHLFDESPQLVPERQAADAEGATGQPVGGLHLFDESPQLVPERQAADAEGATGQPVGGLPLSHESPRLAPERHDAAEVITRQPLSCFHLFDGRAAG